MDEMSLHHSETPFGKTIIWSTDPHPPPMKKT